MNFEKRMQYASFVSQKYPLIYIEIPKCACSTLKSIMLTLDGVAIKRQHVGWESSLDMSIHHREIHPIKSLMDYTKIQQEEMLGSQEYVRFTVVRNPYARLASCWQHKIRQKEPAYIPTCQKINLYHGKKQNDPVSFQDFVAWVSETEDLDDCNTHWMPIMNLLHLDLINYTHIVKTENFNLEMSNVLEKAGVPKDQQATLLNLRVNESLPFNWRNLYDQKLADIVLNIYRKDFEELSYSQDSWKSEEKTLHVTNDYNNLERKALELICARNEVIFELSKKEISQKRLSQQRLPNRLKEAIFSFKKMLKPS